MKIAIIGWGSLVWDPRQLPFKEKTCAWHPDGPRFKIEFSRVSRDSRLTLVLDPEHGTELPTLYVTSTRSELADAVADVRDREGTVLRHIGFVSTEGARSPHDGAAAIHDIVLSWLKDARYDAAVWTALPSNYKDELKHDFSVEHATEYLKGLPEIVRKVALDYIRKAPGQINTSLRIHLQKERIL
jgi:hypothetical protein